jgi:hypothetical protein
MEPYERISSIGPAGVVATACRHRGPDATREAPAVIAVWINWQLARVRARPYGVTERPVVPVKPGNAGGGKGPQLKGNARSNEDRGIGDESSDPRKCSEVADSVAQESEGIAQLSFLCAVRQGVPERRSGLRLRMLPSQRRSSRRGWSEVRGHRGVRSRAMGGRTGARAEKSNLSTTARAAGVHTQAGRSTKPRESGIRRVAIRGGNKRRRKWYCAC